MKSTNNNFSFQATLYNLGQSISRPLKNVEFLEYHARVYPVQITYLLDKAATVGKWANATTSYIHHFFSCHVLGETDVHLHADNCAGQSTIGQGGLYLNFFTT